MFRYGFSIKTRRGQRVDNISIMAPSRPDAERRLRQMYRLCEITGCNANALSRQSETLDVESVISMICAHPAFEGPATVQRAASRNKAGAF